MKIRALLTTGAAMATVAAVAFAAPSLTRGSSAAESLSPAAAAQAVPTVAPPPGMRIHVLNLHQQFARALAQKPAVTGPEAGVVPMVNGHGPADRWHGRHDRADLAERDRHLQGAGLRPDVAWRPGAALAARLPAAVGTRVDQRGLAEPRSPTT